MEHRLAVVERHPAVLEHHPAVVEHRAVDAGPAAGQAAAAYPNVRRFL
jgi:hypothetical protein